MSYFNDERSTDTKEPTGIAARSKFSFRRPTGPTPKQQVEELGLKTGQSILMPDGVARKIRSISDNGEVRVWGVRDPVNVYALKPRE